jgi:hypothetical protein
MDDGFVLGTLSALAWGFADVIVTYLARRGGFFRTLLFTQTFGVALLVVVAFGVGDLPSPSAVQVLALAGLGPMAVAAYAGFYRALELGPIAIVSPIASANGAIVVGDALGAGTGWTVLNDYPVESPPKAGAASTTVAAIDGTSAIALIGIGLAGAAAGAGVAFGVGRLRKTATA